MLSTLANDNNNSIGTQNALTGGLNKDTIDLLKKENSYSHARNVTVVMPDGQRGAIHSEPANKLCTTFPYEPIGFIHLVDDQWAVFMTDDTNSEIGIFYDNECRYESVTKGSQVCLNFNRKNLVYGAARRGFDCGFNIYWADGKRNPDRFINTAKVPWVQNCTTVAGCITCVDTNVLDCNRLRIAPEYTIPCLRLAKGQGSGLLLSGSYQVAIAYTINGIRCTDYCALSNVQSIFDHTGNAGAVVLSVTGAEKVVFDTMEVVIISTINRQVQAKRLGLYSTSQETIYIDDIDQTLSSVDIATIPVATPAYESSDAIFSVNNYLLRVGVTEQPDFNYQPRANQIEIDWVTVDYPGSYYHDGGASERTSSGDIITYPMNVSYLGGEVYAYFIRWVYTTGDKSAVYHIPGWNNTTPSLNGFGGGFVDGGRIVAFGRLGGYVSKEIYPDKSPAVWNSNISSRPDLQLCGKPIRHHRFPDQTTFPFVTDSLTGGSVTGHISDPIVVPGTSNTTNNIRIKGIRVRNILPPVDNNNNIIPNIAGFEILRASREGHQSIVAKGMLNSMRGYKDPYSGKNAFMQNYPYNDLNPDFYLTSNYNVVRVGQPNTQSNPSSNRDLDPLRDYSNSVLSFHSPDTVFDRPYLGLGELKLECLLQGTSTGSFRQSYRHGNFRTITDLNAIISSFLAGVEAIITIANAVAATSAGSPPGLQLAATEDVPVNVDIFYNTNFSLLAAGSDVSTGAKVAMGIANVALAVSWGVIRFVTLQKQLLTLFKSLAPPRAFAWQWDSVGEYNRVTGQFAGSTHRIKDYAYIKGEVQFFAGSAINNLWRNNFVGLELETPIPNLTGFETSRLTMGQRGIRPVDNDSTIGPYVDSLASFYGSYRVPQATQYGQIDSTKNIPISCVYKVDPFVGAPYSTDVIFGGDTYINRYTEKNPMFFFNDWLVDAPDDYEYNYRNYINVPYPRYWIDNTNVYNDLIAIPSRYRHLDAQVNANNLLTLPFGLGGISTYVKNGAFYLFCNGTRDFYVESGVNVGYRDWDDEYAKMFYNPYGPTTDISLLYRSDIIKSPPFYKYDYSLSSAKLYNQYISWGQTLRRDYDPELAYTCFQYYPRRVRYSLPQEEELRRDNWRIFLANNYKDFPSRVTAIEPINKTGALMLFEDRSPAQFMGVDSIPSQTGTDFAVGTGTLFNQALQSITNADSGMQYGSCQNRLAVINTPYGVFWVSRDSGKIFQYTGSVKDITADSIWWWTSKYLPSALLSQVPGYPDADNPLIGTGVQLTFDSVNHILYVCKKEFIPKKDLANFSGGQWYLGPCPPGTGPAGIDPVTGKTLCVSCFGAACKGTPIIYGDPNFFEEVSWTLSYDCRTNQWIGLHDWFPNLTMLSYNHFLTTKKNVLWRHNVRTDLFCNYYGKDYPMEIEVPITTGVENTTLSSVQVLLESYRYRPNSVDKFQVFDTFFNEAIIYNPEQNSGRLLLDLKPWNNPYLSLTYPITTSTGINILYDRVENKYRFNTFYDMTDNRYMFGVGTVQAFNTDNNGYTFTLNTPYFNYAKPPLEQKRFRYTGTRIFLRRTLLNNNSIALRYISTNNIHSKR
jgi:hypothetical protein